MKIKQIKNGEQPRPYADHVWQWDIETEKAYAEILDYCQKNLRKAEREEKQYFLDYRNSNNTFDQTMEIVCGGRYTLTRIPGGWRYTVTKDYID